MKKIIVFSVLWISGLHLSAQVNRANRLFEYRPAPGQFINNPVSGTPEAAVQMLAGTDKLVSLGAFGGSIVLGFEQPVLNDPANPYGIDFSIFGNAFPGSSEPGVIWVMKDENGNGLPDDSWYEIAGSSHFHPFTSRNYRVTWIRNEDGSARWNDNLGNTGILLKNEFHAQPYYPDTQYFSEYPQDSVSFTGSLVGHKADQVNGQIVLPSLAFGYADNRELNRYVSPDQPDNPYTKDIVEGAGGDPVDISWAVDSSGKYIDLDRIHFVKIVTAGLSSLGILGEISTEVTGIVAATPGAASARENITVIHPHAKTAVVLDTLTLYADFFKKGRYADVPLGFEVSDVSKALISAEAQFIALDGGNVEITVTPSGYPDEMAKTSIYIRRPDSLGLKGFESSLPVGSVLKMIPELFDQDRRPIFRRGEWLVESQNSDIVYFTVINDTITLKTLRTGTAGFVIRNIRFPWIEKSFQVEITTTTGPVNVYVSAKTSESNLFASRWLEVSPNTINPFVENRAGDYTSPGYVTVAQVVASILQRAGVNFRFRDDASASSNLYLYSVEQDGLFAYGWGGRTEPAAYARGWIVRHNRVNLLHSFDKALVQNGDTLMIYHVPNLLESWQFSRLTASSDSIRRGDPVRVRREHATVTRALTGFITETPPEPFVNQTVGIRGQTGLTATTGQQGDCVLVIDAELPVVIESGTDAVYIAEKVITSVALPDNHKPVLYPNPVRNEFRIGGVDRAVKLSVADLSGRTVLQREWHPADGFISAETLDRGLYIIAIEDINDVVYIKFLKH